MVTTTVSCEKVKEVILEGLGEQDVVTAALVRKHINSCAGCKEFRRGVIADIYKPLGRVEDHNLPPFDIFE